MDAPIPEAWDIFFNRTIYQQVDRERRSPGINRTGFGILDRPHFEVPQDADNLLPLPNEGDDLHLRPPPSPSSYLDIPQSGNNRSLSSHMILESAKPFNPVFKSPPCK